MNKRIINYFLDGNLEYKILKCIENDSYTEFKNCIQYLSPEGTVTFWKDEKDDIVNLSLSFNNYLTSTFKKILEEIDDDIFVEACELYVNNYNSSLKELDFAINNNLETAKSLINIFLNCIRLASKTKIEKLMVKYDYYDTRDRADCDKAS